MSQAARIAPIGSSAPLHYRFSSSAGEHVLVVPYSRIFDIAADEGEAGQDSIDYELAAAAFGEMLPGEAPLDMVAEPAPQSISLNVSSSCNLTCGYCYAARGGFNGAQTAPMDWLVARAAVDRLVSNAEAASPITIGFLGGEPFANRKLIHRTVDYSADLARARGLDIRFSVTTNGTLLTAADLELFRAHPFAVTVSLDGAEAVHDRQRPRNRKGAGSWRTAIERISPLLERPGAAKIAARATVVRDDMDISHWIETLSAAGFPEVGVAPLRVGASSSGALEDVDWPRYTAALIDASKLELRRLLQGFPIRLTNLAVALKQLHRGASSPYPCGAGGGYFSVSAQGRWYACHRAIGQADFELGSNDGLDVERRRDFLARRHVHAQTDCGQCWARYLCSGGCHQEVGTRTAASCDFIREWLTFCLEAYCELGTPGDARLRNKIAIS
jgi:uncharacterized protein